MRRRVETRVEMRVGMRVGMRLEMKELGARRKLGLKSQRKPIKFAEFENQNPF